MELSEYLLNEFNNIKNKYYDEGIIESKIIQLEAALKKTTSKEEISKLYNKLKEYILKLEDMKKQRLIDFVINKIKQ